MRRDAAETGLVEPPGRATSARSGAASICLHATCIELGPTGVLLLGASGSGKSDLALRLIDAGARLVGDDRLMVERRDEQLFGRSVAALAGLLEVRGFGIVKLPWCSESRLGLAVTLQPEAALTRLPQPEAYDLLGISLPLLRLDPRAPSAGAKIRLALVAERLP